MCRFLHQCQLGVGRKSTIRNWHKVKTCLDQMFWQIYPKLIFSGFLTRGNLCLLNRLKLFWDHVASTASDKKCQNSKRFLLNFRPIFAKRHHMSWICRKYKVVCSTKYIRHTYIASSGPYRILVLFLGITFHNAAHIFYQVQISKASILKRSEKLSKNLPCLYYFVLPYYILHKCNCR